MRKVGLALIGAAALAGSSAASAAIEFTGTTQGCLSLTSAPCTPVNSSTLAGLNFSTGHFDQFTSDSGFAGIGGVFNNDTFGFFSQDGSANNYTGDFFTLLINFTLPPGVSGGGTFAATLIGSVSGAGGNNGGVNVSFAPSTQLFHSSAGDFTLHVNDVAVSGTGAASPISGYIQAVPEPATWAMMLVGFAGMGMAMRRRRNPALAQLA
jgi:hypothetical protein